ncbi:MAG: UDP-2,3-diacylglucosamine diphosphatase [Formivibrio sp.]|nr:UDP-2,3-diacylglucosamine diphosphatase [Formivibrio sp.]
MKPTLFISDLHLTPADPATAEAFATFLADTARQAQALYILGDLFEFWVGDDQLEDPFCATQCRRIIELATHGVPVYFLPGNRDLLVGQRFALACGLTLLPDPYITEIHGEQVLLAHGDAYCSDDRAYQRYRRFVSHATVQWLWFRLPRWLRNRALNRMRKKSQRQTALKPASYTDVNTASIETALMQAGVQTMIHGHTHRPAKHAHEHGTRFVLSDWHNGNGGYLLRDGTGWHQCWLGEPPSSPTNRPETGKFP